VCVHATVVGTSSVVLPLFLGVHAAITVWMAFHDPTAPAHVALHGALLAAAVLFWLPVLGRRRRLGDAGRMVYLYLAMPTLDLAGVYVVLRGDPMGGIAMIAAMLPLGMAAVAVTWRWIVAEERRVAIADAQWRSGNPMRAASAVQPTNSHAT
jgi:hypothetical protein